MMNTNMIAEIGENHYGRWDVAKGMVREAAASGATHAKFQTYTAEQFGRDHRWYKDFKGVEVPEKVHFELQDECRKAGIEFLSSTFTVRSTQFLVEKMGLTALKVASGRIPHLDLMDDINDRADQVKTVFISTGGSTMDEIRTAVEHLNRIEKLYVLHCVSQYPTDDENVNLRMMLDIKREFPQHGIGYSDHSRGSEACLAAVALGAEVLEKHFTYHVNMPGDDHEGGMTPEMLAEMVGQIGRLELMLGSDKKAPVSAEEFALSALRVTLGEVDFE
jgi:sialic acid synthase SpsE